MTTASKITLFRVFLIPVMMVTLYLSGGVSGTWMWISLAIFILGSLSDFVDGQIARRCNQVTDFGKFLDPGRLGSRGFRCRHRYAGNGPVRG